MEWHKQLPSQHKQLQSWLQLNQINAKLKFLIMDEVKDATFWHNVGQAKKQQHGDNHNYYLVNIPSMNGHASFFGEW